MSHGDAILRKANLVKPELPEVIADWHKWKIVIDGKVFKTRWPSYEAWASHYKR
jgi:hypothetical protein